MCQGKVEFQVGGLLRRELEKYQASVRSVDGKPNVSAKVLSALNDRGMGGH